MKKGALVVPALVKHAGDTLYPFFHFTVLVVRRETRRRFGEAVFSDCEARKRPRLYGLQRVAHVSMTWKAPEEKCTYGFVCDELVREELNWRMIVACRDQGMLCVCMHELGECRVNKACTTAK